MSKILSVEKGFIAYLQTTFIATVFALSYIINNDSLSAASINIISLLILISQLSLIIYYYIICRIYKKYKINNQSSNKINHLNKIIKVVIIFHIVAILLIPLSILEWQKITLYNGIIINFFITGLAGFLLLLLPFSYYLFNSYKKEIDKLDNPDSATGITLFNFFLYLSNRQKVLYLIVASFLIAGIVITLIIDINKKDSYISIAPYLIFNYLIISNIAFYYLAKSIPKAYLVVLELVFLIIFTTIFSIFINFNVNIDKLYYFFLPVIALCLFLSRSYSITESKELVVTGSTQSASLTTIGLFSLSLISRWDFEYDVYYFLIGGIYLLIVEWFLVNAIYYYPATAKLEDSEVFMGYTILLLGFTLPCWMLKDSREVIWLLGALLLFYPFNTLLKKEQPPAY